MDVEEPASRVKIVLPRCDHCVSDDEEASRATLSKMSAKDTGTLRGACRRRKIRPSSVTSTRGTSNSIRSGVQTDRQ